MSKARNRGAKAKRPPAKKAKRSAFPDQNYGSKNPRATGANQTQLAKPKKLKTAPIQSSQIGLSVPFDPSHKIFLVGEGDFSFSTALLNAHVCSKLTATTFESCSQLVEKYPQASENVRALEHEGLRVFYNIDATALFHPTRGGGSNLRKLGPFDRIVFNFPHTGGLTKDVNRQVRANQDLCVKFLGAACKEDALARGGRIVVTLFEGEPYELWGIRNLARHSGLEVVRSTRFEWDKYPGYAHARTLGNLKGTGWKGEERKARMYIFGRPGEEERAVVEVPRKRKRRDSDDSDDDAEGFRGYGREDDSEEEYGDDPESHEEEDEKPGIEPSKRSDSEGGTENAEDEMCGNESGSDFDGVDD